MFQSLDATQTQRNSTPAASNGHSNGHPKVLSSAESKPVALKVLSPTSTQNGHVAGFERAQNEPYAVDLTAGHTLAEDHRASLKNASGLSEEVITARGYWTCDGDRETLRQMGFSGNSGRCLIAPRWNHKGEFAGNLARPDIPIPNREGKAAKYLLPKGATQTLDINPLVREKLDDPTIPLLFTEGAKKADSAASHGLPCINLNGVSGHRGTNGLGGIATLTAFDDIPLKGKRADGTKFGRIVCIVFDSDVTTNPKVEGEMLRLARVLSSRGAIVKIVSLEAGPNGEKTGLDDFFARDDGTAEKLFLRARDLESEAERKARGIGQKVNTAIAAAKAIPSTDAQAV